MSDIYLAAHGFKCHVSVYHMQHICMIHCMLHVFEMLLQASAADEEEEEEQLYPFLTTLGKT